jgi:uncharacterized protein
MHIDFAVALAGLFVGFTVGLTGMGGGALMTPLLVLVFNVQPLAAVSSDLVAAVVMKPIGAGVHLRRGTVNIPLARWLMLGSVPAAFAGVLVIRQLGNGPAVQERVKLALGAALVVAAPPSWPSPSCRRGGCGPRMPSGPPRRRGPVGPPPSSSAPSAVWSWA